MQLTGFLVEYLIIGSITLIWVLPGRALVPELQITKELLVLLAPALYGVGMFIDAVSHYITIGFDRKIRECIVTQSAKSVPKPGIIEALLFYHNVDLANVLRQKTSRARVARAAITNVLLGTMASVVYWALGLKVPPLYLLLPVGVVGVILAGLFWARWQRQAYEFELEAWVIVTKAKELDPTIREQEAKDSG